MRNILNFLYDFLWILIVVFIWGHFIGVFTPLSFVQGQMLVVCALITLLMYAVTSHRPFPPKQR